MTTADRRVVRRALLAGGAAWALLSAVLVAGVVTAGGSGGEGLEATALGLAVGVLVTAGWLVASVILDLLAGAAIGRGRVAWTVGAAVAAFVAPMLVLGAQSR